MMCRILTDDKNNLSDSNNKFTYLRSISVGTHNGQAINFNQ